MTQKNKKNLKLLHTQRIELQCAYKAIKFTLIRMTLN